MNEEDDDAKVHEPTPRKLEQARKRGEVPVSQDIASAATFAAIVAALAVLAPAGLEEAFVALSTVIEAPERFLRVGGFESSAVLGLHVTAAAELLLPALSAAVVTALLAFVVQRSVTFAPSKIAPKANRISPIRGAKQKFGREGLFAFAKSLVRLVLYATMAALVIAGALGAIIGSTGLDRIGVIAATAELAGKFTFQAVAAMLTLGLIDLFWQRTSFNRRQRMSQTELKDEMKESEGDQSQKSARRQRAQELSRSGNIADAAGADVVIVNPEHYAVALRWSRETGAAPVVLTKGADKIAARIRQVANENGVPIRRDPLTARAIFATVAVGEEIEPGHFRAVAAAIRFADAMRGRARLRTRTSPDG